MLLPVGETHHKAVGTVARLPVGVYDALQFILRYTRLPLQKARHISAGHHLTGKIQLEVGKFPCLVKDGSLICLYGIEKIKGSFIRDHLFHLDLQFFRGCGLRLLLGDHRCLVCVTDDGLTGGKDVAPRQRYSADSEGGHGYAQYDQHRRTRGR